MKVWLNGCFDVLHYGHFKLIDYAVSLGEHLIIGIDSDRRVKELKGNNRPYHTEQERRYNLLSVKGVNRVIIFDSEEELCWYLKNIAPDIRVIGSDYKNKPIVGADLSKSIMFFDRLDFSTTDILETQSF
jgi:D-beta-D-heptose 7-phosphate kinase/D-beta-D-heptose 1-phosphate adenosyltransferase